MRINYNTQAMRANNALNVADKSLSASLRRLSSGLKLNSSKDNPSGYAIARRMNTQISGVGIATNNANTGINIIETADGALTEIHEMLQRMNELAVKGAHGVLTTVDRSMLQEEMKHLKEEVERVARDTEFNGQPLLDGSFDLKGYTDNLNAKVAYYSDDVLSRVYTLDELKIVYDKDGNIDIGNSTFKPSATDSGFPEGAKISKATDNTITITDDRGFELSLDITATPVPLTDPTTGDITGYEVEFLADPTAGREYALSIDITGIGAMDMQIGANEGQSLAIRIPTISLRRMGIENADVSTQEKSDKAITEVRNAIMYVSNVRSRLGAYQNRLEHTVNNLDITTENMTSSYSRIMDTDMADEMTRYTTQQILSQASVSMIAQANERPSQVLQLLQ